jgi:hypothetical protein
MGALDTFFLGTKIENRIERNKSGNQASGKGVADVKQIKKILTKI